MTLAEELAVECAAIKAGIVFTGDMPDEGHVQLLRNFLKLRHALDVDIFIFGVVRKIACKEDEIRPLRQGIDHINGAFESLCTQRVRRAIESNVGVTELHEREG